MNEVILQILVNLVFIALPVLVGYVVVKFKKLIDKNAQIQQLLHNKELTTMIVLYVETVYSNLNGKDKFEKAKSRLLEVLKEKNVKVSESELELLIESVLREVKSVGQAK